MAFAERAVFDQRQSRLRELQKPNEVRDRSAAAPQPPREFVLGDVEVLDERRARTRLLNGVEVLPRHVLDQRKLEALGVLGRADDGRDAFEARLLRSAQTPLAGDQLVLAARERPHDDRLQDAAGANRIGERVERRLVEVRPGLLGIGADQLDRELAVSLLAGRSTLGQDGREAAADAAAGVAR